jgi:hypothetical protein
MNTELLGTRKETCVAAIESEKETRKVDFSTLEILARMTDTKIEAREIVDKWLLMTYDIPVSEEGNKARYQFYLKARHLGATQHTESVYLMPWMPEAELMALDLAKIGKVIVWTAAATTESQAAEITARYDKALIPVLKEISTRIDRIAVLVEKEKSGLAQKMVEKTETMIKDMEKAILRRGSASMLIYLLTIKQRFDSNISRI